MNPKIEDNNNLKKIRQEKGLTIADVASKLKLTQSVISKIEDSKFNELGAYTYVRGYLNHYAELLEIDAEPYINLIHKDDFSVPLINTKPNISRRITIGRKSKYMANYAFGTIIVLAVSFSGWFLLKNYISNNKQSQHNLEIVTNDGLEIAPEQQISVEASRENNNAELYHFSSLIPEVNSHQGEQKQNHAEPNNDNVNSTTIENTEELLEQTKSMDVSYQIKISTTADSWIEVKKSDGTKLYTNLLKFGEISLESEKPVHFIIGNQANVVMTINNAEINLNEYSSNNVANFNWPVDG